MFDIRSVESGGEQQKEQQQQQIDSGDIMSTRCRRRSFQRQACLLSVMAAFTLGLALGVFIPLIGMSSAITDIETTNQLTDNSVVIINSTNIKTKYKLKGNNLNSLTFPLIDDIRKETSINVKNPYTPVSFVTEQKLRADEVFRNAFHLEQNNEDNTMIVKKLDPNDGSIKEFTVQRTEDGYFRKSPEVKLSKPSITEQMLTQTNTIGDTDSSNKHASVEFVLQGEQIITEKDPDGVIVDDIYWGPTVEKALPIGFENQQTEDWNSYIRNGVVVRLETGCGRMQNRMVIFQDGKRACARYRQNTDQIQGELFSFYLGHLLNLSNLAPSTASVIDLNTELWASASQDISNAQWKVSRPVVLTKWVSDLEPAGIPLPFQPLERHLNKLDVKNITLGLDIPKPARGLLDRLGASPQTKSMELQPIRPPGAPLTKQMISRLIELAQWSDLIVFDYLIANLDRVVNNLYNFQWNADIMAAPAHNLAKKSDSQLLVFLDNESGLLHGYRLLKKYEAYHGLLLDNLCVFRKPTIDALRKIKEEGIGKKLQQIFEQSTNSNLRDVLPPLPDKSIKILEDRIDRVLGQVQKCHELFSNSNNR